MADMNEDFDFDDDEFWKLIDTANQDFAAFTRALEAMTREELIGFSWKFQDTAGMLYDEEHGVNYPSEDYFEDLAAYVVARGKKFYNEALEDPAKMPKEMKMALPGIEIQYEANKIYREKFRESLPPFQG